MTVDSLLSSPLSTNVRAEITLHRSTAQYNNESDKYRVKEKNYEKQYCDTYFKRLDAIRSMIIEQSKEECVKNIPIVKMSELREEDQPDREEDILVVGTIFKQQEKKPGILKELSEDKGLEKEEEVTKFTDETDHLVLEDETMRVRLCGNVKPGEFVNGVVMGCVGREAKGGLFDVKKFIYPKIPAPKKEQVEEVSICVVSGLQLDGEDGGDVLASIQLAVDWVCGAAGGIQDQETATKLERMIFAGDSLAESTKGKADVTRARYLTQNKLAGSVGAMKQLDNLLAQLAGSINTDIIPGENDPTTGLLPQQPLHKCMFPQTRRYPTFQSVTNPYNCSIGGRSIVVIGGQTIRDITRNSDLTESLDIMEKCVRWGHLAPTCPDTIGCYPYHVEDPLVVTTLPDLLIAGNQDAFGERTIDVCGKSVLLVSVPKFVETKTLVKIDLGNLKCHCMEFDFGLEASPESPEPNH